nr:hypothetical protein CFP56_16674 [Quercus suber]
MPLGIAFRDHGQLLPRPRFGGFERKSHHPLDGDLRENRHLRRDGMIRMLMRDAPLACVFPLAIFSDDDPVQIVRGVAQLCQRCRRSLENPRRSHVDVLVHRLPDGQDQAPQRDVVRDIRPADRAEVDGVVHLEFGLPRFRGHVPSPLQVCFRRPVEMRKGEVERAVRFGERVQGLDRGFGDIDADPVAGDAGDLVCFHAHGIVVGQAFWGALQSKCSHESLDGRWCHDTRRPTRVCKPGLLARCSLYPTSIAVYRRDRKWPLRSGR